jgi:hypothetical protein
MRVAIGVGGPFKTGPKAAKDKQESKQKIKKKRKLSMQKNICSSEKRRDK